MSAHEPSPKRPEHDSGRWLLVVAACSVVWGTIPLVIRRIDPVYVDLSFMAQSYDAAPILIVFWRVVVAGIAMLLYLLARRRVHTLREVDRGTFGGLALNGVLLALHWFLFFSALTLTDVAIAELLTFTGPIYVAALTPLVLKERFDPRVLMPIALALSGMALVLGPDMEALRQGDGIAGAAMALFAALIFAFLMLNAKRLLRGVPSAVVMFWETFFAVLLLLPAALWLPSFQNWESWAAVLTLGIVHSGVVAFVFLTALRHVRADHAAVLMYIEPVVAVVLAALFLGEPLGPTTLIGGAAVIAGGALVARLARTPGPEGPFADIEGSASSPE